jgi:hypothetical protein
MSSPCLVAIWKGAIEILMCFCELVWRLIPYAEMLVSLWLSKMRSCRYYVFSSTKVSILPKTAWPNHMVARLSKRCS